jgi:toxin ParE1/3/4
VDVFFTPSARLQFLSAIETIRRKNRTAAREFQQQTARALKRLARPPQSGTVVPEFPELPYREVYIKLYRFFYRVREDRVWIVALWHGAQIPDEPENPHSNEVPT